MKKLIDIAWLKVDVWVNDNPAESRDEGWLTALDCPICGNPPKKPLFGIGGFLTIFACGNPCEIELEI